MTSLKQTLGNKNLRAVLVAQIPADFADWLDFVAIGALLAFTWNAEPIAFAFLAVGMGLPYLIIGPIAGALVDRASLKNVMIASNLGRAVTTGALAFAPDWRILVVLVFLRSAVDAFYTPAKQSAIQALVKPDDLMSANSFSLAINQISKIAAPALGGVLLVALTPQNVFFLNVVVSLVAALLLFLVAPIPRPDKSDAQATSLFTEVKEGFTTVTQNTTLRSVLLIMAAGYFAMFFYDTLIAPMTRDLLHYTETTLGLALAAVGAGGLLGALSLSLVSNQTRSFFWISAGSAISGILVAILGLVEVANQAFPQVWFLLVFAVIGFATSMVVVPVRTIIQQETAPTHIARVTALSEAANTIALLIAPFVGASIAAAFSVGAAFILGGAIMVMLAIWAIVIGRR